MMMPLAGVIAEDDNAFEMDALPLGESQPPALAPFDLELISDFGMTADGTGGFFSEEIFFPTMVDQSFWGNATGEETFGQDVQDPQINEGTKERESPRQGDIIASAGHPTVRRGAPSRPRPR